MLAEYGWADSRGPRPKWTCTVLDILLDDGEPVRNVPASFAEQGQEVISVTGEGAYHRVRVRKG